MILYDRVYNLDDFITIHKGGQEPILRNCGLEATFLFENLQCIPSVPDHFDGMLSMCSNYVVGAIEGSLEDPCSNINDYPPEYLLPGFAECDAYFNITCDDLGTGPDFTIRPDRSDLAPIGGLWESVEAVAAYQAELKAANPATTTCLSVVHGWVFDFGNSPLDGSISFINKHANGEAPEAISDYCGADMTDAFDSAVPGGCVPLHTLGALNAVSGYVVGVIEGDLVDPCTYVPPDPCLDHTFTYYSMNGQDDPDFRNAAGSVCPIVILGKVYDLNTFAPHHFGGEEKVSRRCHSDVTEEWLGEDEHIPLYHLGSVQDFQIGLIRDSVSDPCSANYDATKDF